MQLKTCEKITRSPAYKFVCATIILWRQLTKRKCYKAFPVTLLQLFSRAEDGGPPVILPYVNHLLAGKTNTAHEGLKKYASIYRPGGQTQELEIHTKL